MLRAHEYGTVSEAVAMQSNRSRHQSVDLRPTQHASAVLEGPRGDKASVANLANILFCDRMHGVLGALGAFALIEERGIERFCRSSI